MVYRHDTTLFVFYGWVRNGIVFVIMVRNRMVFVIIDGDYMESIVVYNTKVELLYSDALTSGVTINGFKTFRAVLFGIELFYGLVIGNV